MRKKKTRASSVKASLWALILLAFLPLEAWAQASIDMPVVRLRSLDKTTARTVTFEANVGSTIKFGSVYIKVRACRKAPEMETPESASFLQVWEVNKDKTTGEDDAEWVFSGWMFASSPGLSSMDHPIYDVWVLDCLQNKDEVPATTEEDQSLEGEGEIDEQSAPSPSQPEDGEA